MVSESGGPALRRSIVQKQTLSVKEEVVERLHRKIKELEKKIEAREQLPKPEVKMVAPFTSSIMDAAR